MAPDGALGIAESTSEPHTSRRRSRTSTPGSLTSLPTPGSPGTGRSESATR